MDKIFSYPIHHDTLSSANLGLTTEQANQLSSIYSHFSNDLYLGKEITVSLTGSHTNSSYVTKVVYINQYSTVIHLLGTTSLASNNFTTNRAYRWNVSVTIGTNTYTINDCMTPTIDQIMNYSSGYYTGFSYWLNSYNGSSRGWYVYYTGRVYDDVFSYAFSVLPYIVVNL